VAYHCGKICHKVCRKGKVSDLFLIVKGTRSPFLSDVILRRRDNNNTVI
jgi:hypothetical protein